MRKSRIVKNLQSLLPIGPVILIVSLIGISSSFYSLLYGHIFSTDETASFVAFTNQLQIESELVQTNLANNNASLAQKHANKAASLLTPSIMIEIAEENERIADELTTAVNGLQKISSSSSERQLQNVNQLVSDINATLDEAVSIRIEQRQGEDSSNFLEKGIEFLGGIFGGGDSNEEAEDKGNRDITIQPLAFADLVDSVLINYGNAYAVGFDMTDMSNMAMMGGDSSGMTMDDMAKDDNNNTKADINMGSMNMSSHTTMNTESETNGNYSLVDIADYESAHALAAKALEIFNVELKPMASNNNNTTAFIANLENGLTQLNNSIRNKAPPIDIMMIVHTQVHPNLLEGFNLELR
jgi:hypothetical protein